MPDSALESAPARDSILRLLKAALACRLTLGGASVDGIEEDSHLLELGIIDSTALLDIILEVEAGSGRTFDPLRLDMESGVTLAMLAGAFEES